MFMHMHSYFVVALVLSEVVGHGARAVEVRTAHEQSEACCFQYHYKPPTTTTITTTTTTPTY